MSKTQGPSMPSTEGEGESSRKTAPRSKESIRQMKARLRKEKMKESQALVKDPFEKADAAFACTRKKTGLVYDDAMLKHKCEWDPGYPECPERYSAVKRRFEQLDLISKCVLLPSVHIDEEPILKMHNSNIVNELKKISESGIVDMEKTAAQYDAIYFNAYTLKAATLSAGCVLSAIKAVCTEEVQNAFALVRPPGHHAMANEYCGYCYFNNVAIGAKEALDHKWANKILIVDFDIHHGQATQQMFYEDNRVLYFSMHRYEHGKFWPNLRESNFDFIGDGLGKGFNVNVPLNVTRLNDGDYFAVVFNILLPIAYEFNPDLILYSAGYDACIGCPEGEMNISPGFYGQLITLLGGLAKGKHVVCLEGGYFLDSLAEGAAMSLKSLLDDPPASVKPFGLPAPAIVDVINNLKFMLRPYWKCFEPFELHDEGDDLHVVEVKHLSMPLIPPYETRNCYPIQPKEEIEKFKSIVADYKKEYAAIKDGGVCYTFDSAMYSHKPPERCPEKPERIARLLEKFDELKLYERCASVPSRKATADELRLVHDERYVNSLFDGSYKPVSRDIHFGEGSLDAILSSAGCLLNVVDAVVTDKHRAGVAMIRPPGHHAGADCASGFCFVSNVALAAKYILKNYGKKRILVVDFDVHHGDGTQSALYDSKDVLYVSVHQYNKGSFFPTGPDGNFDRVGEGEGVGFNVNIPFNKDSGKIDHLTDKDYLPVFQRVILPIAYSYGPEVVLVSAGFDAGIDDPLGNYAVTPEGFGHFIQLLKPLAQGKMILALEGGYNVNTVAYSMNMCVKALLGDPLPQLDVGVPVKGCLRSITNVIGAQKQYWPILGVDRKLPSKIKSLSLVKGDQPVVFENPDLNSIQKLQVQD